MNPLAAITAFFTALGQALGLVKQRDAEKNTDAMVKAKEAQQAQDQRDADAKLDADATQTGDVKRHDAALAEERKEDSL